MPSELHIAYVLYLVWLTAGLADFICHWRTDLPHTSGVAESGAHLVQLLLLATAIVLGMTFMPSPLCALLVGALVALHAVVGYIDSWFAFHRGRTVFPVEQHIHSILDMAPPIALAWWVMATWPATISGDWALALRQPPLPWVIWAMVLAPAAVLCTLPALWEFRAAWKARGHATESMAT
ncbi:MAG: hypothetical protein EOP93_20990 [Lysobacteraceae bacterium]|nr:MAG: hypothetical protein EOP93_20990 [Xanthomonadaceae bacterium]